jgi:hypothetical protein
VFVIFYIGCVSWVINSLTCTVRQNERNMGKIKCIKNAERGQAVALIGRGQMTSDSLNAKVSTSNQYPLSLPRARRRRAEQPLEVRRAAATVQPRGLRQVQ